MIAFTPDPSAFEPKYGITALTDAERSVLRRIAAGRTTRQISIERGVSIHTVRVQLSHVYRKLRVKHRGELMLVALQNGFGA